MIEGIVDKCSILVDIWRGNGVDRRRLGDLTGENRTSGNGRIPAASLEVLCRSGTFGVCTRVV